MFTHRPRLRASHIADLAHRTHLARLALSVPGPSITTIVARDTVRLRPTLHEVVERCGKLVVAMRRHELIDLCGT